MTTHNFTFTFYSDQYDISSLEKWNGPGRDSIYRCRDFSPPYVDITVPVASIGMLLTFAQSYALPSHRSTATPYWDVFFPNKYEDIDERFLEITVAFRDENNGTSLHMPFLSS